MGRRGDHSFKEISSMILDAAEEIVEKEGYLKLSTRKIAMKIGYTVGTLYNVYKNLDDIILHLNGRTLEKLLVVIQKSGAGTGKTTLDSFKRMAFAYAQFSRDHFNLWDMLANHRLSEDTQVPKWYRESVQKLFQTIGSQIKIMSPTESQSDINDEVSVLWASVHGICALSIKGKFDNAQSHSEAETLIDNLITNYFKGLARTG